MLFGKGASNQACTALVSDAFSSLLEVGILQPESVVAKMSNHVINFFDIVLPSLPYGAK